MVEMNQGEVRLLKKNDEEAGLLAADGSGGYTMSK